MVDIFGNIVYKQAVQNWLLFFVILIVAVILGKIIYTFCKYVVRRVTVNTRTKFDDILIDVLEEPLVFLVFVIAFWFAWPLLNMPENTNDIVYKILQVIIVLTVAFFVVRLSDSLIVATVQRRGFKADTSLKRLLPAIQKLVKIAVFIVAALVIFEVWGLSITSLLAGLGLGGLAVALAAKDTLSNIFGSVSVITDQAFKVGDKIKIDGYEGVVEDIGIRSTRIKTPKNTQIIVPNSKLLSTVLENVSRREDRRRSLQIILKQGTGADKIQAAIDIIKTALHNKNAIESKYFVNFAEITTVGPVIEVAYWVKNKRLHREFKEELNFAIKRGFEENNIELAATAMPINK